MTGAWLPLSGLLPWSLGAALPPHAEAKRGRLPLSKWNQWEEETQALQGEGWVEGGGEGEILSVQTLSLREEGPGPSPWRLIPAGQPQSSRKSQLFCLREPLRSPCEGWDQRGPGVATYIFRVRAFLHGGSSESQRSVLESQTSPHGRTHTRALLYVRAPGLAGSSLPYHTPRGSR